jgi:hypothetical protein
LAASILDLSTNARTFCLNVFSPYDYFPRVNAYSVKLSACASNNSDVKQRVVSYKPRFSLILYDSKAKTA